MKCHSSQYIRCWGAIEEINQEAGVMRYIDVAVFQEGGGKFHGEGQIRSNIAQS